jgi:hypothetical protein
MHKKEYIAIGKIIARAIREDAAGGIPLAVLIPAMVQLFKQDNPLFDESRFLEFVHKESGLEADPYNLLEGGGA